MVEPPVDTELTFPEFDPSPIIPTSFAAFVAQVLLRVDDAT
jgi:hypothetical protein